MEKRNLEWMALMGCALVLQGCAHGSLNKRLDEKLAQESAVESRAGLQAEAGQLIESSQGLTPEQRSRLVALRDSVGARTEQLHLQSLKLRSILIKDIISANYNEDEVELIKKRIKNLENQRLTVIFGAVEDANRILGREASANQRIVHEFFMEHHGPRM